MRTILEIDPHPLSRGGSFSICAISTMHIYVASLLLAQPLTDNATSVQAILVAFKAMRAPDGVHFMAASMIACAIIALAGATFRLGWIRLAVFLPQQIILGCAAFGGVVAAVHGHYLDGTAYYSWGEHIPWQHISADQIGFLMLFAIHGSAIIRRARDPNG